MQRQAVHLKKRLTNSKETQATMDKMYGKDAGTDKWKPSPKEEITREEAIERILKEQQRYR